MVRRSGIICGPIWGSFPVQGSFAVQFGGYFRSGDHLGGVLGYNRDGGGVRRIFLGLKFSTPVFFWVEDLTVYFFGSEKSARIFLDSNFRQANSSYAIQVKVPARSESMIRIICM